ncbi:hypothetical protein B0H10DRAFT_1673083, partial [Mycena sp. CBHHK59/15]
ALERNASLPRAKGRLVPKPLIIEVRINDKWCRALVDSGSLGDFMSTTLADQLHVKRIVLTNPLPLQLAVKGSRSKINCGTRVNFKYPSEAALEGARNELRKYALPICRVAHETTLPPLRAINHTIPLIDEKKIYPWRPSRCPEPLRAQWDAKRQAYLKSGRWRITNSGNTVPMLLIPKPKT